MVIRLLPASKRPPSMTVGDTWRHPHVCYPAGVDAWDGSLVDNMEGVSLSPTAPPAEPLLQSMRSEVEAAWEEHAAKKSKLNSPEPLHGGHVKVRAAGSRAAFIAYTVLPNVAAFAGNRPGSKLVAARSRQEH